MMSALTITKRGRALLLVSVFLIASGSISTALAQGSTGLVDGQLVDASGSGIAGATVTVSDSGTGLTRTVSTNASGNFKMQLPPGSYELKSSKAGFSEVTIELVKVNLGVTTNLTIPVQEIEIEEITAYGTATPLMPAATGETGLNISLAELSRVPVARNIESVALLAPGTVAGDVQFGDDKTLVSFAGASVAENVYYIDGLNVTNFRNGLGGASVPFEFYDQIQIKTGGYSAEFGRSTGGVINAVTKRGSNDFEYGVVSYTETNLLQGSSPNTIRANGTMYAFKSEDEETRLTTDIYVSGPIFKDRLFFYALYELSETNTEFNWTSSPTTRIEQETDDDFYGGNLTWNITDNHALSYTTFTDEREIFWTKFSYDFEQETTLDNIGFAVDRRGGDNNILRYDGYFGDNLAVSALWGKNEYDLTSFSSNDAQCPLIIDESDSSTDVYGAGSCWVNGLITAGRDEREAYRLDIEYYIGDHTIRVGFDREDNLSIQAETYSGTDYIPDAVGGIYYRYRTEDVGAQLQNGAILPDLNGDGSRVNLIRTRYYEGGGSFDTIQQAWYLEDTWAVNDAFTISAGIRNEKFDNRDADGDTFIAVDDQWAPRIALQWSMGDRSDQVITLNWGRYHLPIVANTNVRLAGGELDFRRFFYDDPDLGCTTRDSTGSPGCLDSNGVPTSQEIGTILVTSDGTVPDSRGLIDLGIEPMFQDEWILQYERELNDSWTAGVRYIRRDLSSTIDDILVDFGLEEMAARGEFDGPIGLSNACHYVLANPGHDLTTYCDWYVIAGDPSSGTELRETTIPAEDLGFPEAERTYEAVEVTFHGGMDKWNIRGSYTWSKNKGNTEGFVKSDNGQDDAGLTEDFDIPQLMDGAFGYLPNDRRHKLKLWAAYEFSDRLRLGANLLLQSGRPINAFGISHPDGTPAYGDTFYLADGEGGFTFVPRGTAGRTPWVTRLDLAAIYSFSWGDRADVELRAEVFNVFNADNATEVYEFAEIRPDQFRLPTSFQRPRYISIGAALRFR